MNGGILMNKNLFLLLLTLSSTMLYSMEEQEVCNDQPGSSKQEKISEPVRLWRLLSNDDKGFPSVLFITALQYTKQSNDAIDKLPIPSELKTYIIDIKDNLGKQLVELATHHGYCLSEQDKQNIEFIINAGANINAQDEYGFTALMYAALYGEMTLILLFIKNNALLDLQNIYGQTALFNAANFHQDAAKLLIEKGANINLQSVVPIKFETPLIGAAKRGKKNTVEILIEKGANINHQTVKGDTALIEAARNGYKDIVELLINKGADVTITNLEHQTALEIAREHGQEQTVNFLENAENKPGNEKHT